MRCKLLKLLAFSILTLFTQIPAFPQEAQAQHKPWWSASAEQVQNAHCRRARPFTDSEIERAILSSASLFTPRVSRNVFGIEIRDEDESLIRVLESLLRYDDYFEEERKKHQSYFRSSCSTVMCALKDPSVFGPKLGPRLALLLMRYGYNGSHYIHKNADRWRIIDLDEILIALDDFPAGIFPVVRGGVRPLSRFKRGYTLALYGASNQVVANSVIQVFDTWEPLPRGHRQSTIVHEVAHNVARTFALDSNEDWLQMSGWREIPGSRDENGRNPEYHLGHRSAVVSKYGEETPGEDFAESLVAYRYNPRTLLRTSPQKYRYLQETVFDGIEYLSERHCRNENRFSRHIGREILWVSYHQYRDEKLIQQASDASISCIAEIFESAGGGPQMNAHALRSFEECVEQSATEWIGKSSDQIKDLSYGNHAARGVLKHVSRHHLTPGFRDRVIERVSSRFRRLMTEVMRTHEVRVDYQYSLQRSEKKPVQEYCSDYAYTITLSAKSAAMDETIGIQHFAGNNSTLLREFANRVCLLSYARHRRIRPIHPRDMPALVDQALGYRVNRR